MKWVRRKKFTFTVILVSFALAYGFVAMIVWTLFFIIMAFGGILLWGLASLLEDLSYFPPSTYGRRLKHF